MSGLLKLVEVLPLTKIERLECAPASSDCLCVSARWHTYSLTISHTAPCLQTLLQRDRRRGRLRTLRRPQGDADHPPRVRRRPIVFAFVSAPLTSLLSQYIHSVLLVHSLEDNDLTDEAEQALQDAAGSSVCIDF